MENQEGREPIRTREDVEKELIQLRDVNFTLHERIESLNGAISEYHKERREYIDEIGRLRAALVAALHLLTHYLKGPQ